MKKCIKSFQSEGSDEFFAVGNQISDEDYEKLSFEEQGCFEEDKAEDNYVEREEDFLLKNFPGISEEK